MGCVIEDCDRKLAAKGYCHLHYNRWKRHGDPNVARRMMPRNASVAERIERLTVRGPSPDDCHVFTGGLAGKYARVKIRGVVKGLHVWALIEATGVDFSATMDALHSCDNPPCANPRHLRWGTLQDNMDDKVARGRQSRLRGEDSPTARLTWDAVRAIRSRPEESLGALALEFGVSRSTISLIRRNERWIEDAA